MNRIKELRTEYGKRMPSGKLTQQTLADACDDSIKTGQTIQRYESGERELTIEKLRAVAAGFTALGFPTKASDLLMSEDQAISEDHELTKKISSLEDDLKNQHDDFLEYLLEKQRNQD